MVNIDKMRERAGYFRQQAAWLRETGAKSHVTDDSLRRRFVELAAECEAIAEKIEHNIAAGIHKP